MMRFMWKFVVVVALIAVSNVRPTAGLFVDSENSLDNNFIASSLDIALSTTSGAPIVSPYVSISDMEPGDVESSSLRVNNVGGLLPVYIPTIVATGDAPLCEALHVDVLRDASLVYSGPLSLFDVSSAVMTGVLDDWSFEITLIDGVTSVENLGCDFTISYSAWQQGLSFSGGFHDVESFAGVVTSGEWGASAGDVVINEVMWMGANAGPHPDADEWVELRNMTGDDIDLTDWTIERAGSGDSSITLSGIIPAGGYFLIGHYASTDSEIANAIIVDQVVAGISLANGGEQLVLRTAGAEVIDQTPVGSWPAGVNSDTRKSMERNSVPGDGSLGGSWHSCIDVVCNDGTYWDTDDGTTYGTPGLENHSDNDTSLIALSFESGEDGDEGDSGGSEGEESSDDEFVEPVVSPLPDLIIGDDEDGSDEDDGDVVEVVSEEGVPEEEVVVDEVMEEFDGLDESEGVESQDIEGDSGEEGSSAESESSNTEEESQEIN